jgi:hypothetical protein
MPGSLTGLTGPQTIAQFVGTYLPVAACGRGLVAARLPLLLCLPFFETCHGTLGQQPMGILSLCTYVKMEIHGSAPLVVKKFV